ncbi:hypothetical protein ABTK75_20395, partial [Acinetobacter baumannii]
QVGPGQQAWLAAQTQLNASGGVLLKGTSNITAAGNVSANTGSVTAAAAGSTQTRSEWAVQGALQLLNAGAASATAS